MNTADINIRSHVNIYRRSIITVVGNKIYDAAQTTTTVSKISRQNGLRSKQRTHAYYSTTLGLISRYTKNETAIARSKIAVPSALADEEEAAAAAVPPPYGYQCLQRRPRNGKPYNMQIIVQQNFAF